MLLPYAGNACEDNTSSHKAMLLIPLNMFCTNYIAFQYMIYHDCLYYGGIVVDKMA
jgi:hypothetical protein